MGFEVMVGLAKKFGGEWEANKKVENEVSSFKFQVSSKKEEQIYLLKPQTFMNQSGEAVAKFLQFYKPSTLYPLSSTLWLVHDDIDLELGRLKIQIGGGSAGHHGVESVLSQLKGIDIVRFRMGVGRPVGELRTENLELKTGKDWVLGKFSREEKVVAEKMIGRCVEAVEVALGEGVEKVMSRFNG